MKENITKRVNWLRNTRKIHRISGIFLALFFVILAFSGLALAWKKNSYEILMARTHSGISNDSSNWLAIDSLIHIASSAAIDQELDKIDIRPNDGIAKFIFAPDQQEIQIDLTSGNLVSNSIRYSDWFERIHDGSLLSNNFKLFYSSLLGISLILFCVTGLWMYIEPKNIKKLKRNR